ncbi:MAG: hypothetical protein Q4A31_07235 [Corynebacterium sp.]|uniref:hypothetical protein n=1 Tax=Corynebacterium sp. TaxID=1720 RepID=UPI0026DCC9E2|nr:hypothetical protein [Corynebacterium sp.]MDO4761694.1 hypothetical protein [Corynebacterium sp.]
MSSLFVRIDLTIPGAGSTTHIAELVPQAAGMCALVRMIELDPQGRIHGMATADKMVGMASAPQKLVPHPDSYADFPDIESSSVSQEEFDSLWQEAKVKFPDF